MGYRSRTFGPNFYGELGFETFAAYFFYENAFLGKSNGKPQLSFRLLFEDQDLTMVEHDFRTAGAVDFSAPKFAGVVCPPVDRFARGLRPGSIPASLLQ